MNTKVKKILSIFLSLVLSLGLMEGTATTALAYEGNPYADLVNTTTTVTFNGMEWYIVEDNSTSANAGRVTLLLKSNLFESGLIDILTGKTFQDKLNEYVTSGSFKDVADVMVASSAGNKLLIPSKKGAESLADDVRKNGTIWWTATSIESGFFWDVQKDGSFGNGVYTTVHGIRPTCKLDLTKVVFNTGTRTFTPGAAVSGVSLTPGSANLNVGGKVSLTASISPENASYKTVKWSVGGTNASAVTLYSNENCTTAVTLNSATDTLTVYAKGASVGTAAITVTATNGTDAETDDKTASCTVTVSKAANPLTYDETQTVTKTYSTSSQTATLAAASNAAGDLSYGITSQKQGEQTVEYFSLSGTTLTIAANTPAGTYTVVTYAMAAGNGSYYSKTLNSTVTVTVNKANAVASTLTANNRTYDGTEQPLVTADDSTLAGSQMQYALGNATQATGSYSATIPAKTDAGTYYLWYKVIGDANHNDSSESKLEVTIDKRNVSFTSATDDKPYDGNALTNDEVTVGGDGFATGEGASFDVTGSQKIVGSSVNTFSYTLNDGTKADNYNVTTSEGVLTVTSRDPKFEIKPQANSGCFLYDTGEHTVEGLETDTFEVEGNTFTVSGLSGGVTETDAGEYTVNVTGTAVVRDEDGNDVSSEFSVIPQAGTMTINKRTVTITSASDSKEYDGETLTNDKITFSGDGFINGEGVTIDVTGRQKVPGSSPNTFSYTLNQKTKEKNYRITIKEGTLEVTGRAAKYEIRPQANSDRVVYDGRSHTVKGFETEAFEVEGERYTVSGLDAAVSKTNAGEYSVNVTGTAVVTDSDGNDVSSEFSVIPQAGKLTIEKAEVTVQAPEANELEYLGKELELVTKGQAEGGVLLYSLDGATFDEAVPTAVNAGEYTVFYKVAGDSNHNDSAVQEIKVTIIPPEFTKLTSRKYENFKGEEKFVLNAVNENLLISSQGCKGVNLVFELEAAKAGYKLVTTMDNYGHNVVFTLTFDKETGTVKAAVNY